MKREKKNKQDEWKKAKDTVNMREADEWIHITIS